MIRDRTLKNLVADNDYTGRGLKEISILNTYIFIAIALDQSIFLGVIHFPMKNIKSHDLGATPMGGAKSKPASDVVCLLLLA